MEKKVKISPFQLLVLLTLSRMFTIMTYSSGGNGANVSLITIPLSALLQFGLLLLSFWLCTSAKGCSPLLVQGKGAGLLHTALVLIYWILMLVAGVAAALNFTHLLVTVFYEFRQAFWVITILILSAGVAVSQGLEAFSRAAVVFGIMMLAGLAAIAFGLWREYSWFNFVLPRWNPGRSIRGIYQGFAMNFELVAALLILPYAGNGRSRPTLAGWWLGIVAILTEGIIVMLMLTLGGYGANQQFPVFSAAALSRLVVFENLDAVFLALWVVMGVIKLTLYLFLAVELWGELWRREPKAGIIWLNTGILLVLGFCCLLLPQVASQIYKWVSAGAITLTGVLMLPALSWLSRKVEKNKI